MLEKRRLIKILVNFLYICKAFSTQISSKTEYGESKSHGLVFYIVQFLIYVILPSIILAFVVNHRYSLFSKKNHDKIGIVIKILFFLFVLYAATDLSISKEQLEKEKDVYLRKFRYLTSYSLYFTLFTVILGFLVKYDFISGADLIYNNFLSFSLSINLTVAILNYVLNTINRSLVGGKPDSNIIPGMPAFSNLCEHLFPLLLLILEQEKVRLEYSVFVVISCLSFGLFYFFIANISFLLNNEWPYKILENMANYWRFLFVLGISFFTIILQYGIIFLNNLSVVFT